MTHKTYRQKAALWILAALVTFTFLGVTPHVSPVFAADCIEATCDG